MTLAVHKIEVRYYRALEFGGTYHGVFTAHRLDARLAFSYGSGIGV